MTQIQLRRATAASWTSVNPILALGEVGIETDTYKLKVGNGTSQWSSLAYFVHAWADITGKPDLTSYATLTGTQTLTGKTLTSPRVNAILDTNGATNISIGAVASAVNYFQVNNAAMGNSVNLYALGADTNIDLNLLPKGSGSVLANSVPLVTTTATQSLSNKTLTGVTVSSGTVSGTRINPRIATPSASATPAINVDTTDQANITANQAITSMTSGLTGTPVDGQKLLLRIKDNGAARAITWGASFMASGGTPLPTTTVVNKTHLIGFIYDSSVAKWVCVAADSAGY